MINTKKCSSENRPPGDIKPSHWSTSQASSSGHKTPAFHLQILLQVQDDLRKMKFLPSSHQVNEESLINISCIRMWSVFYLSLHIYIYTHTPAKRHAWTVLEIRATGRDSWGAIRNPAAQSSLRHILLFWVSTHFFPPLFTVLLELGSTGACHKKSVWKTNLKKKVKA